MDICIVVYTNSVLSLVYQSRLSKLILWHFPAAASYHYVNDIYNDNLKIKLPEITLCCLWLEINTLQAVY